MRISKLMSSAFPYLAFAMMCGLVLEVAIPESCFLYPYIEQAAMPVGMATFIAACWPIAFPAEFDDDE